MCNIGDSRAEHQPSQHAETIRQPLTIPRAVARCVSFHETLFIVPTLTSILQGTAPAEKEDKAEQFPQQNPNTQVAGGTSDPATKIVMNQSNPVICMNQPTLTTDQAEQIILPKPPKQVAGGTSDPAAKTLTTQSGPVICKKHPTITTDQAEQRKLPKPPTEIAGGTGDPATPKSNPTTTFLRKPNQNAKEIITGSTVNPTTPNNPPSMPTPKRKRSQEIQPPSKYQNYSLKPKMKKRKPKENHQVTPTQTEANKCS